MTKNWTGKLRKAQNERNAWIVASIGPYRDEPVTWAPRYDYDRRPWVLTRFVDKSLTPYEARLYRYTGRECHPVFRNRESNSGNQ
jgi:hypothetical protein